MQADRRRPSGRRLTGLRHGASSLALAADADLKTVQTLLGHASIVLTADTYTSVLPELLADAAEATARLAHAARTPGPTPVRAVRPAGVSTGQRPNHSKPGVCAGDASADEFGGAPRQCVQSGRFRPRRVHDDRPALLGRARTALPSSLSPVVGREADLERFSALVRQGTHLLTICGLAGVGKTRLAGATCGCRPSLPSMPPEWHAVCIR
jgi:hypothetical protein